jgi:hypothetical protein
VAQSKVGTLAHFSVGSNKGAQHLLELATSFAHAQKALSDVVH